MCSHFCPHLPGTQRLKRLRAARCGASESCKYYSSFPCPLLLLLWARDVEIPIITTKPSLCHLDDSPHMAKILFAVLSAEQWSPRPGQSPCSYGKPICAKQICTSSFVTRGSGCQPLLRRGLESHSSTRQQDTDECRVLPEVDGCWGSRGMNEYAQRLQEGQHPPKQNKKQPYFKLNPLKNSTTQSWKPHFCNFCWIQQHSTRFRAWDKKVEFRLS